MSLFIPPHGASILQTNSGASTAEFGAVVTASSSTHTKGNYAQLVASTNYVSYGAMITLSSVGTSSGVNTSMLVDVAIGGAGSEGVIIPDLDASGAGQYLTYYSLPVTYFFPIIIPSGVRVAARCQSAVSSDTVYATIWLIQNAVPGAWYGSRVTAYGVDAANSCGTLHTASSNTGSYATTTQLTASTANPIRYMQICASLGTAASSSVSSRNLVRIAAGGSTNYVASDLPYRENASFESFDCQLANFLLSRMAFRIPSGSYLGVGAQGSSSGQGARSFIIYGVD